MKLPKNFGFILLAASAGLLAGAKINAQNPAPGRIAAPVAAPLPPDVYPDSRNRLPAPKREDMDEYGKKVYDQLMQGKPLSDGSLRAGFLPANTPQASVRLYSPRYAQAISEAGHYLKYETGLSDRLMEVAILTAAYELNCQYEWTQWERFGRNPADPRHIEQSTIDIIKYNKPLTGLGEKETAVISFARELFGERKVSSETFAAVLRLFGPKGTVDLVELMGLYSVASLELTAFDEQLQVGQTPLLPARSVTVTANCVTR